MLLKELGAWSCKPDLNIIPCWKMGSTLNVDSEGGWTMSQCKQTNKMFFCLFFVCFFTASWIRWKWIKASRRYEEQHKIWGFIGPASLAELSINSQTSLLRKAMSVALVCLSNTKISCSWSLRAILKSVVFFPQSTLRKSLPVSFKAEKICWLLTAQHQLGMNLSEITTS